MVLRRNLVLQVVFFISLQLNGTYSKAQSTFYQMRAVGCCVDSILKGIGRADAVAELLSGSRDFAANGYRLTINEGRLELENLEGHQKNVISSDSINNWLGLTDLDSIRVFSIKEKGIQYFILCSPNVIASGIASEFFIYLLLNVDSLRAITLSLDFSSLSNDPRLFYIKNGSLYYARLDFGDIYRYKGYDTIDFDSPIIEIITYRVEGNALRKIKSTQMKCSSLKR